MVEHVNQQLISSAVFALQEEWENFAKVGCSEQIFRLYVKMGQLNHRHVLLKSCFSFKEGWHRSIRRPYTLSSTDLTYGDRNQM